MNNAQQPWHSAEGRLQYGLRPANPTEEGLASLHSVLFRKQPFLWRAALLYYTIHQAAHMSFRQLFQDLARYVQDADVRWEYCVRAKRGQTDTSKPGGQDSRELPGRRRGLGFRVKNLLAPALTGCFSKDQVYLDGIVRILRHRQTIDFPLLTSLGKVTTGVPVCPPPFCNIPCASDSCWTEFSVSDLSGAGSMGEVEQRR